LYFVVLNIKFLYFLIELRCEFDFLAIQIYYQLGCPIKKSVVLTIFMKNDIILFYKFNIKNKIKTIMWKHEKRDI